MHARCGQLAVLGGVLYCVAFPTFDLWPLAFVALLPLMWCVDVAPRPRTALFAGALAGFIASQGRGYFLVETLAHFSGLPWATSALLSVLLCAWQGGQLVLFVWLLQQARRRGLMIGAWAPLAFATTEFVYPRIFHSYLANALHDQSLALQIVDLGGPGLLSMAVVLVTGALYELLRRIVDPRRSTVGVADDADDPHAAHVGPGRLTALVVGCALCWACVLGYGSYRSHEVEARMAAATPFHVGLVQANAGMFDKFKQRRRYYLRHYRSSRALEREAPLDLLIWPETAVQQVRDTKATHGALTTPLLFGTHMRREVAGDSRRFNSAMLLAADGALLGTYDKRHLLPFGEYLPLSDRFPAIRSLSPRTGHFSAGEGDPSLHLGRFRIGPLICYEDVVPGFVREAVRTGRPHLLVNMTNDAWFGDTNAPWLHLALAKFRAVEHHRYLVRATNSGVTAVIDPLGRTVAQAKTFSRARMHAQVEMLEGSTPYGRFGDVPGVLALLANLALLMVRRRTPGPSSG